MMTVSIQTPILHFAAQNLHEHVKEFFRKLLTIWHALSKSIVNSGLYKYYHDSEASVNPDI